MNSRDFKEIDLQGMTRREKTEPPAIRIGGFQRVVPFGFLDSPHAPVFSYPPISCSLTQSTLFGGRSDHIASTQLEMRLIGAFQLLSAKADHTPVKRKAAAILAYLILTGQSRETRGRLAALLWSESDEERARASLRQCIHDLKQVEADAGRPFLNVDKLAVGARPGCFHTDIAALDAALENDAFGDVSRLLANARDGLCAGLYDCDPVFDNWLRMQSTAWSDRTVSRLAALLEDADPEDRRSIAVCILQLDPFFEPAVLEMLRLRHDEGGYARALAYFERYAEELREELDLAPPRRVAEELAMLREASTPRRQQPATTGAKPAPERPTIAIITVRGDAENAHIQFALASELSASLSRFRHWTAVQVEMEASAGTGILKTIGDAVDLAVIIDLEVEQGRHVFEISCHDVPDGTLLFTMKALPDSSSWRSASNEFCAQIAARLQIAISSARLHRIGKTSPQQISAYDCWLDGQRLSLLWRKDTEQAAVERYEEAIRLDPNLSCAYSGLAGVLNSRWIVWPGSPDNGQDLARAFELAKKAVLLDPFDHRNQVNLAWSHLLAHRWQLAEFHFELAHDLNARNPTTLIAYALASSYLGEHRRAAELSRLAFQLSPVNDPHFHGYQATIAFLAGDFQGCVDAARQSDGLFPDLSGWSAAANAAMGRDEDARADFGRFVERLAEAWSGRGKPDRTRASEWLKTAFPIRQPADRRRLAEAVDRAERTSRYLQRAIT